MAGKVTMAEIAHTAGVSRVTVHYALTGKGTLAPETRARIQALAEQLGYRPNRLARSLRTQRTATFGVILPLLDSAFFAALLSGIEQAALEHDHSVLVGCSHGDPQREQGLVELFLEKAVDGLLISPVRPESNAEYYRGLVEEGVVVTWVDCCVPGVEADAVSTDNLRGGYLAGEHLARLGRRRVVFLVRPGDLEQDTSFRDRLAGCNEALLDAGRPRARVLQQPTAPGASYVEHAYLAVSAYLGEGGELDGLFVPHDPLAYGAISALQDGGRAVPEQVSVVGFDDLDLSGYTHPPLTTVRQPAGEIGREGVRVLLERLQDRRRPPQRVKLDPQLVVRASCGAGQPSRANLDC